MSEVAEAPESVTDERPEDEKPSTDRKPTEYVVLTKSPDSFGFEIVNELDSDGQPVGYAGDSDRAIKAAAKNLPDGDHPERTYVAVPLRSFRPVRLQVEQKRVETLEPAAL